jgi:DNA repair protein RadA/Sms
VRPVAQASARLKEAKKLGFGRAVIPEAARSEGDNGLTLDGVGALSKLVADIAARGTRAQRSDRRLADDD